MLGNHRMETAHTEVTLIWRRNDIEKSTWRTHRYFVNFKGRRIHVKISTSNRCHKFHVDSPIKINEITTNFPRGMLTLNRWRIDKDVSIGMGGLDLVDQRTAAYHLDRKSSIRFYLKISFYLMDVGCASSYIAYDILHLDDLTLLNFKIAVATRSGLILAQREPLQIIISDLKGHIDSNTSRLKSKPPSRVSINSPSMCLLLCRGHR